MRIKRLELSGFRAFAQAVEFDLDADAIIIVGANGRGKTSIFDGVLWALAGRIPRLGDDSRLVSLYSPSGEARVSLDLRTSDDGTCHLIRRFDGQQQYFQLNVNGEVLRGSAASARLLELLWPEGLATSNSEAALTTAVTRSVYLEQDLVRQFVEADDDQARFKTVSELVGAGTVTDLALQLERARTAWTTATNSRARDAEQLRQRLAARDARLAQIGTAKPIDEISVERLWSEWWAKSREMADIGETAPGPDSPQAGAALDAGVKDLSASRHANDRRRDLATELLSYLRDELAADRPDEVALQSELEGAKRDLDDVRRALEDVQRRAAEERRAQLQLQEAREELRTLARLAMRHLGDRCPVCAQTYDQAETRRRLEELAEGPDDQSVVSTADEVAELSASLERSERGLAEIQARLRQAELAAREWRVWKAERDRGAEELGLDPTLESDALGEQLRSLISELDDVSSALAAHQEEGESLALKLAEAAQDARKTELEREVANLRAEVAEVDELLRSREQTGDLASRILEGLREASSDVVEAQVDRIVPLLQRIYARMDPHPAFRAVRLLTRITRGRGRLSTQIDDDLADLSSESPESVLSSSQMNALAVAVFFALNLGVSTPLSAAMLDDPLQSLDDVNLLGLIDLLRRTKDRRQLIVSTHDARFGSLLELKLRPVSSDQRTRLIELDEWTREGPVVNQRDVVGDTRPLRIAV